MRRLLNQLLRLWHQDDDRTALIGDLEEEFASRVRPSKRGRSRWPCPTALGLAAAGPYGLTARRVTERRRAIGVRVALRAAPGRIRCLVLRDGLVNVAAGLVVGLPAAFAASQLTASYLHGVTPTEPRVFVGAAFVHSAAALLAKRSPARRASRIDPVTVRKE